MGLFKDIRRAWKQKTNMPKGHYEMKKTKLGWNIYQNFMTMDEHIKKYSFIHYVFKYKFWVPIILIADKMLSKFSTEFYDWNPNKPVKCDKCGVDHVPTKTRDGISKEPHNINLWIFDQAYDQTINEWVGVYRRKVREFGGEDASDDWVRKQLANASSVRYLRIMKKIVLTMAARDTAYKEFLNMLMYNLTIKMNNTHDKERIQHVLYSNRAIDDITYFTLQYIIADNKDLKDVKINVLEQRFFDKENWTVEKGSKIDIYTEKEKGFAERSEKAEEERKVRESQRDRVPAGDSGKTEGKTSETETIPRSSDTESKQTTPTETN